MKPTCLLITSLLLAVSPVAWSQTSEPKIGDPPPALTLAKVLQAPEGTKLSWATLKGKVVVLEFWATWCGPCVAAIPHLNELSDQFKNQAIQFIAVTDEDEKIIAPFLKRKPIHAWVGLDTNKAMFKEYGISGIPHTVIVDKKGKIVGITHPTMLTEQVLKDAVAGKKLALAQPSQDRRGSIRPGEVPYGGDQAQSSLFQVLIRPTPADAQNGTGMASGNGGLTICGNTVFGVLSSCYSISPIRVVTNCTLPEGKFDFVVKTPARNRDAARTWLRQAVETTFDLQGKRETRDMEVFILSVAKPNSEKLTPTVSTGGSSSRSGPGTLQGVNQPIGSLAWSLEGQLGKPVLDETGLTNHYDFELKWTDSAQENTKPDPLAQALREQLGLELKPARRPVEVLIVEKAAKRDD
jgi:uncharacterized protein (TIGR03435 family)